MSKYKLIYVGATLLLAIVLGLATYKAFELSMKEWAVPGSCPAIGFIPACYIVFIGFATALMGHFFSLRYRIPILFIIGLSIPTLLAIVGTIGQIFGFLECPKTTGGTPMCFISLGGCSICWLLWFVARRHKVGQRCYAV